LLENILDIFEELEIEKLVKKLVYDDKTYKKLSLLIEDTVEAELKMSA